MIIAGIYSFNNGREVIESRYSAELQEVKQAITAVDAQAHKIKVSEEKTMPGKMLYDPTSLNETFNLGLEPRQWKKHRIRCEYPTQYY